MRPFFALILFLVSGPALAAKPAILQDVTSERRGDRFVVELEFDKAVEATEKDVEYINETVQLNIKGASVNKGKVFTEINDDKVKSLYTYQLNKALMRTRVIHHKPLDAKDFKDQVTVEAKNNRIVMTIKNSVEKAASLPAIPPVDLNSELDQALGKAKDEMDSSEISEDSLSVVKAEMEEPASEERKPSSAASTKDSKKDQPLAESEIPVLVSESKKEGSQDSPYFRMIMSLIIVLCIGVGAVIFAKRWAKKKGVEHKHGRIKVLTQHHLGPKKSLAIVRVAGESILIGITDHNISMLKSLALLDEDLPEDIPVNFDDALDDVGEPEDKVELTAPRMPASKMKAEINEEDFSMGRIKDMVSSKLREMRTL